MDKLRYVPTSDGIGSCFLRTEPNRTEKISNRTEPNRPNFSKFQTEPNRAEKVLNRTEPNRLKDIKLIDFSSFLKMFTYTNLLET